MKWIALIAAVTATQADALSCLRPDPVETFRQLAAAPETYYVLHGQLAFDESLLPSEMDNQSGQPDPIAARFVGNGLSPTGFDLPYAADLTLQVGCSGPWCGQTESGVDLVAFAEVTPDGVVIAAGACGGRIFERPAPAVLQQLTACINGDC